MADWKYKRSEFKLPPAQLEHAEVTIKFFEDRVEAEGTLRLRARKQMNEIALDLEGEKVTYALDREYAADETFELKVSHVSHPDDVRLEGIYKDVTPSGAPQQYMSQCQQFGFQRILPIIDDCTAKCTFRTTLEGDARYTHLISNGDLVRDEPVDGGRRRCVYEMNKPMAPYLFIACAGTWDVLKDSVTYPDNGKVVNLEYLVPPGRLEGAKIPMEILKKSVLFQHEKTGFVYPFDTYRTICMEKSLFGGMENTGNTTIITEAALIDETITDRRLVYAYGVIPHEFEHSHCGSGVTMETPFDMWLNEAYTVNIEREFVAREFGKTFMRAKEIQALRDQGGAFAEEEGWVASPVVREGVNDPDEVVDAITYDKAPEVLNTLRNYLGDEVYYKAWREYFTRFDGKNANTIDFVKVFNEVSGSNVGKFIKPWLTRGCHPTVVVDWKWSRGKLTVEAAWSEFWDLESYDFVIPVTFAAVRGGKDIAQGTIILDREKKTCSVKCEEPDFISWNRGGSFYGFVDSGPSDEELMSQALTDPDVLNRADAIDKLAECAMPQNWLLTWKKIFNDDSLGIDDKTIVLDIRKNQYDRTARGNVISVNNLLHLKRASVAVSIGAERLAGELSDVPPQGLDAESVKRRAWDNVILKILSESDAPEARTAIRRYLKKSKNITARLNALRALVASDAPDRYKILEEEGKKLRRTLNGYAGWLGVVASDPHADVFDRVRAEERRSSWSIKHPTLSRALYCEMTKNWDVLWTADGLRWLEATIVKYAQVSEYNAVRLLEPVVNYKFLSSGVGRSVVIMLKRIAEKLPQEKYPFIGGRLALMLRDDSDDTGIETKLDIERLYVPAKKERNAGNQKHNG